MRSPTSRSCATSYDILVVDAFSFHATPVHLLTREAGTLYARHLKPDGILAIHVPGSQGPGG